MNDVNTQASGSETARPTRRGFCLQACQIASLAAVGGMLEACGGSPTSPSVNAPALPIVTSSVTNGSIVLNLDAGSPLGTVGGAALVRASGNELLVTRTAPSSAIALTAICTHENCTITGLLEQRFVCPCHGSQYTSEGNVVTGPATRSLRQFAASVAGSTLTIVL